MIHSMTILPLIWQWKNWLTIPSNGIIMNQKKYLWNCQCLNPYTPNFFSVGIGSCTRGKGRTRTHLVQLPCAVLKHDCPPTISQEEPSLKPSPEPQSTCRLLGQTPRQSSKILASPLIARTHFASVRQPHLSTLELPDLWSGILASFFIL